MLFYFRLKFFAGNAAMQCCVSLLCGDTVSENKMQKAFTETLKINQE